MSDNLPALRGPRPLRTLLPGRACATCRRHKTRCDSGKPICGTCLVHERDCVYEPRKSKLRKLEERLKTLEQAFTIVEGVQSCSGPFSNYSKGSTRLDIPELVLSPNTPFPVSDERIPDLEVWNTSEELPVSLRVQLLEILMRNRSIWNIDIYVPRWRQAIQLPSSDPTSFHPALVNAIAATAVSLCTSGYQPYVDLFLQRAIELSDNSLAFCDRVEDWMYTQILLIGYWSRVGNALTSFSAISAVVAVGLACNLHQLSDPTQHAMHDWGILPPPLDDFHVAERVNLWWTLYLLDRLIAIMAGIPSLCLLDAFRIMTTPLPISYSEVLRNGLSAYPSLTLPETFKPKGVTAEDRDLSGHTSLALRLKAVTILLCVGFNHFVDSESPSDRNHRFIRDRPDWADFAALQEHISVALMTMPDAAHSDSFTILSSVERIPSLSSSPSDRGASPFSFMSTDVEFDPETAAGLETKTPVDPVVARSLVELLHAAIVLYDRRAELKKSTEALPGSESKLAAETDEERFARESCYSRRLTAARSMAYVARRLGDVKKIYAPMCFAPSFCQAINVIIKEFRRLSPLSLVSSPLTGYPSTVLPSSSPAYIEQLKVDLESILDASKPLVLFFPGLQSYLDGARYVYITLPPSSVSPATHEPSESDG